VAVAAAEGAGGAAVAVGEGLGVQAGRVAEEIGQLVLRRWIGFVGLDFGFVTLKSTAEW
jgi:hypothetical protein